MKRTLLPLIVIALTSASTGLSAADLTWSGSGADANWSTGANWAGTPPANGDNLVFAGAAQPANNNDLATLASGWLRFDAGGFTLGGNALTLAAGITNTASAYGATVNLNLTLSAAQIFESQGGSLVLGGGITNAGYMLTFEGGGDTTSSSMISGSGGVVKNGAGTLTFSGAAAVNNTFTGGLTVNQGIVLSTKANGSAYGGSGNGNVVVNNGGTFRASGDNSLVGQTTSAAKTIQINSGGTVDNVGTTTCHLNAVVLNGGTLTATTPNGTWGNWNLDNGVSTLGNGSVSLIGSVVGGGGNVTLGQGGGTVFNIGAGDTVTVNSVIAKTTSATDLGLIKTGSGVLELAADNTYTSKTTISNGTLRVLTATAIPSSASIMVYGTGIFDVGYSGFSVGTDQVLGGTGSVIGSLYDNNALATVAPGGSGTPGTFTIDTLSLAGNLALNFDLANVTTVGSGVNDLLVVTNLTLSSAYTNNVNFTFLNGTPAVGTYTLIRYTNGPAAGPVYTLAAVASRYLYTFTSDGTSIKVNVSGAPAPLVWRGDGAANLWDVNGATNWMNGTTKDVFLQGDNATFNETGSNVPAIYLTGSILPAVVTVTNFSKDYTFAGSGKISGSASLLKQGKATLTINNANDFTGPTTVSAGAVNLQVANAIVGPVNANNAAVNVNAAGGMAGQSTVTNGGVITVNAVGGATGATNTANNGGNLVLNANSGSSGAAQGTINVNSGGTNTLLVGNTYGYSGTPWVRTLNIVNGLVDQRANGDNGWGITITMTGGELRANGGVATTAGVPHYSLGGGSYLNVTASPVTALVSGQVNLREGNTIVTPGISLLPITVADGAADPDLLISAALIGGNGFLKTGPGNLLLTGPNNYSGVTVISNGVVQVGSGGTSGALGTGLVTNYSTLVFNRSDALTVSPAMHGTGVVQQVGSGALVLNGASTYSGPTTVSAGTLQGGGTLNSSITVLSGANLSAGGVLAAGTLTVSNVTMNSGAGLVFDLNSTAATGDQIAARGTLALDSTATPITVNFLGGVPFVGSPYTIITNWVPRSGNLSFANPTRYSYVLDTSNPNRVQLTFTGTNANIVWNGNLNNQWNANGDANWLFAGLPVKFFQADGVIFDATGAGTPNVSLAGTMNPASVTVDANNDYSFSGGSIGGIGTLTKSGTGTLTVSNNLANTGGAVIGVGTLQLGNGSAVAGNITDQGALVINRTDNYTYAGVISGPGTVTKSGTGTFTQIGANTLFGPTIVNNGVLQFGAGLNAGLPGPGTITVTSPGALSFFRNDSPTIASPLLGNGTFNFIGTGQQGQSSYTLSATNTLTGTLNLNLARVLPNYGAVSLGNPASIIAQPGSQVYAVNNSGSTNALFNVYSIPLTLAGTGWYETAGLLGALRINGGAIWAGPITLAANTRITAYNDGNNNQITGTITGGYELEVGAAGGTSALLTLAPSAPNSFNALRVSPGTVVMGNANALPVVPLYMNGGTLRLNGLSYAPADFFSPGGGSIQNGSTNTAITLTLNPSTDVVYAGTFVNGSTQPLAVIKNGPRWLTLNGGANTFTGGLTVNGGTIVALGNQSGNRLANASQVTINSGARFLFGEVNALPTGANSVNFTINSGGTLLLTNYTGAAGFHAHMGNLLFAGGLMIGAAGSPYDAQDFQLNGNLVATGNVASVITLSNYMNFNGTRIFSVEDGTPAVDLTISGNIKGGAWVKTGAGTLQWNGTALYAGATTISGGKLALGPLASLTGSITLQSNAVLDASSPGGLTLGAVTFGGTGTVIGNITDGVGTTIIPGSSAGTLTLNGNLTLSGYGSLSYELANTTTEGSGVNDLIQVNGSLSLQDVAPTPVNFTFLNGAPAVGTYTLMNVTGGITGTGAGLTNTQGYAVTFSVSGGKVQATFAAGPSQSLVWQGDSVLNSWDLSTISVNWYNGSVLTNFYQLDTVRFDDTRTAVNTAVSITAAVTPASMTLDSTNNYSFTGTGKISGATTITKNNTNTVSLGTANDFIGPVVVNGGTLQPVNATALGSTVAATVINNSGTLDVNGLNLGAEPVVISGTGVGGNGAVVNSGAQQTQALFQMALGGDASIGGVNRWDVRSAGSVVDLQGYKLTKTGNNYIAFVSTAVTNTGDIIVNQGTLAFAVSTVVTNTGSITLNPGSTLSVGNWGSTLVVSKPIGMTNAILQTDSTGANGTAALLSTMQIAGTNLVNAQATSTLTLSNTVGGPGLLATTNVGALQLVAANTYAGGTIISNAPVTPTNSAAAAGVSAILVAQPNALGSGTVTFNLSQVTTNTATNTLRVMEFNVTGGGVVPNAFNFPTATITNFSIQGRDNSSLFTLAGKLSGGFAYQTNWIDSATANSLGVVRLSNAANDFVAQALNVNRGNLAITADGCLGNSANVLRLSQAAANINGAGLRFDAPAINVAHPLLMGAAAVLDLYGDNNGDGVPETMNDATISGSISGGGTIYVRGTNALLTLSGASTYSGGFELQRPVTLQFGASNNLGTAYVSIKGGSTLRYTGTGSETMTRNLFNNDAVLPGGTVDIPSATASLTWNTAGGSVNQPFFKTGAGALTFGGTTAIFNGGVINLDGGALTINTVISGSTQIKVNTGTMTLGAANTCNGGVFANAGTLFVTGSLPAANALTVASGATLGGTGTINCPVTLQPGSLLKPGVNAIGTLTVRSPLTLAGTTATTMEINGTTGANDVIAGVSTMTYGGALTVSNLGSDPAPGAKFTLFSAQVRQGTFNGGVTLPAFTVPNRAWINNLALDGSIQVAYTGSLTSPTLTNSVSGNTLTLSWPADHIGWRLLVQTNALTTGISTNWFTYPNSANVNSVSIPINPANPTVFYELAQP